MRGDGTLQVGPVGRQNHQVVDLKRDGDVSFYNSADTCLMNWRQLEIDRIADEIIEFLASLLKFNWRDGPKSWFG